MSEEVLVLGKLGPKFWNKKFRYYFAIDLLTVALSWCLTQQFTLLVAIQQVQHIYYVLNWNKSHMAKRGTVEARYLSLKLIYEVFTIFPAVGMF